MFEYRTSNIQYRLLRCLMAKGFNKGSQLGGGGMMAQLQKMQQQLADAQAKLAEETVTATAGGGAIKVVMTGDQKCQSVEINPDLLKDADAEMLQDLVLSAVNMALDQSRELQQRMLGPLAGGLPF
ncbi:MAG TPA: YbaB/EbfC family nucleoid-associated protein [Anaerolineales bacterium]|nr:YbaB/EbfC family nucleoid-associated protein [Anaerolineales bacterium]